MGIGALGSSYGNGYDYRGYSATDSTKTGETFSEYKSKVGDVNEIQDGQLCYEKSVYALYMDTVGNAYTTDNNSGEDWAKTISLSYAAESTQNDPVVEISVTRYGETFAEKVHINDVNPGKCTQQEIKAYLYHYDETNGTQGSYETLMAYAQTAQKQGYWDGNDSLEEFANDTYSWKGMFTDVWTGEARLGLAINRNLENLPEFKIYNAMEHDFIKHIDFDIKDAKLIDMRTNRDKVSLHFEDLLPDVPREIVDFLHQNCFSGANVFFEGGGKFLFSDHTFNMVLSRIGEQIKADGSLGNIDKAWQSALKIVEEMSVGVENFYGEALGSDTDTQMNVYGMKKLYDSIAEKIKNKIENEGNTEEKTEETDSGFSEFIRNYIENMISQILSGDTTQKYAIGGISLTIDEWNQLLDKFDEAEEDIVKELKEELEKYYQGRINTDTASTENSSETSDVDTDFAGQLLTSETKTVSFGNGKPEDKNFYVVSYDSKGIRCSKSGSSDGVLWEVPFTESTQYEKVMEFMNSFPADWELKFATSEQFWKDYLNGDIDEADFRSFMESTDRGIPQMTVKKDGKDVFNRNALKYSTYMHDPESRMYTGEEFIDMVFSQIESNQRALRSFSNAHPDYSNDKAASAALSLAFKGELLGYSSVADIRSFSSYESENYRWEANNEDGIFRIYDKNGNRLGAVKYSDLKIKVDPATGTELLVSEFGTMYDAIPLNAELRKGLSDILGSDNVETETLSEYTVKRHQGTGLKYIVKDGEEGRGGRTLITSPEEQATFDKLANEYMAKYPNLVKDSFAAAFYADLEVRGLSGRTDNGIFTMGWDAINFRDDKDYTKNWGMRFNEGGYEILLNWFNSNNHDNRTLQSISSWIRALNGIGYERLASRMEEQQGFFFNY